MCDDILKQLHALQYEKKLLTLYTFNKQWHKEVKKPFDNVMLNILDFAMKERLIISVESFNSGLDNVTGFVKKLENSFIEIQTVDDFGFQNSTAVILNGMLTFIWS